VSFGSTGVNALEAMSAKLKITPNFFIVIFSDF